MSIGLDGIMVEGDAFHMYLFHFFSLVLRRIFHESEKEEVRIRCVRERIGGTSVSTSVR